MHFVSGWLIEATNPSRFAFQTYAEFKKTHVYLIMNIAQFDARKDSVKPFIFPAKRKEEK